MKKTLILTLWHCLAAQLLCAQTPGAGATNLPAQLVDVRMSAPVYAQNEADNPPRRFKRFTEYGFTFRVQGEGIFSVVDDSLTLHEVKGANGADVPIYWEPFMRLDSPGSTNPPVRVADRPAWSQSNSYRPFGKKDETQFVMGFTQKDMSPGIIHRVKGTVRVRTEGKKDTATFRFDANTITVQSNEFFAVTFALPEPLHFANMPQIRDTGFRVVILGDCNIIEDVEITIGDHVEKTRSSSYSPDKVEKTVTSAPTGEFAVTVTYIAETQEHVAVIDAEFEMTERGLIAK